ncbi:MAG: homoserine dehydrogenase [Desulfovibrionales bacterium]|nr:homoserine dehydrogenase [Desulfovibrionales bacterium]
MPRNKPLVLAIAGFGTVGSGLLTVIKENRDSIIERTGREIVVKSVLVRDLSKPRAADLPEGCVLTDDPSVLLNDPEVDVLVELIGGISAAKNLITKAITAGKHIVTANKALLAEDSRELFALAAEHNVHLTYEASVCAAIPILTTLKGNLAGNDIQSIVGILNGTANYILSEMTTKKLDFTTALKAAQDLGFAEADPTLDIEGFDAAHKLCLLTRLGFGVDYPFEKLPVVGVSKIHPKDIEFAREFGYRVKLLGQVRKVNGKIEAGVFPTLVHHTLLIARVGGAYNAIRLEGNACGPLFLHGQGAGDLPTASAVLGDIVTIGRGVKPNNSGFVEQLLPEADILAPEDATSKYYFRVMVNDVPGVLRDLAGTLSEQDISIAQAIQKGEESDTVVPVVFLTHEARAEAVSKAVESMKAKGLVVEEPVFYRIL